MCQVPLEAAQYDYELDPLLPAFIELSETLTGASNLDRHLASQYLERFASHPQLTKALPLLIKAYQGDHARQSAIARRRPARDHERQGRQRRGNPGGDLAAKQVIYVWYVSAFFLPRSDDRETAGAGVVLRHAGTILPRAAVVGHSCACPHDAGRAARPLGQCAGNLMLRRSSVEGRTMRPMVNEPEFDVIIVGSGIAGALAAYRLAQARYRVLILEAGGVAPDSIGRWSMAHYYWTSPSKSPDSPFCADGVLPIDPNNPAAELPVRAAEPDRPAGSGQVELLRIPRPGRFPQSKSVQELL